MTGIWTSHRSLHVISFTLVTETREFPDRASTEDVIVDGVDTGDVAVEWSNRSI